MAISLQIQPGSILYTSAWQESLKRYQKAVQRASFLSEEEKGKWLLLGYRLNSQELAQAEGVILEEDMKRLKTRHQLTRLKPESKNKKQKH